MTCPSPWVRLFITSILELAWAFAFLTVLSMQFATVCLRVLRSAGVVLDCGLCRRCSALAVEKPCGLPIPSECLHVLVQV